MYDLSDSLIEQIKAIAEQYEALKLMLLSSRAHGNFVPTATSTSWSSGTTPIPLF